MKREQKVEMMNLSEIIEGRNPHITRKDMAEIKLFTEKNIPNDKKKWAASKAAAKKKFKVYPSAYANAWAAKDYKSRGGSWRIKQ